MPFEVLNSTRPDISHLRVFRCGAYVYIPDDVQVNKLTPRAEVMIFLSYNTSGTKGFKFMQKPNNVIFHGVTAMFDKHMFLKSKSTLKVLPKDGCSPFRDVRYLLKSLYLTFESCHNLHNFSNFTSLESC